LATTAARKSDMCFAFSLPPRHAGPMPPRTVFSRWVTSSEAHSCRRVNGRG
jgi:hypothetical protein